MGLSSQPGPPEHAHALVCPKHQKGRSTRHYHEGDAGPHQAPGASTPTGRSNTLKRHRSRCEALGPSPGVTLHQAAWPRAHLIQWCETVPTTSNQATVAKRDWKLTS